MKNPAALLLLFAVLLIDGRAETLTFDFKDSRGVNNVAFRLDAPLESIKGTAKEFSGTITVDPANLSGARGRVAAATKSLIVPNPLMRMHLLSKDWLNAKAYPEISFEIRRVLVVEKESPDVSTVKVTGLFTLNGVSKEITADAKVTYMPGRLREASKGKREGDLLVIRSEFEIKRSDFGIRPREFLDRVADEIDLSLSIAGGALKKS
jgi:polyisoprenoid-binding protein YceI